MEILKFSDFINENAINESGIPLYKGSIIEPEKTIKRSKLMQELQVLLGQVAEGKIKEISILAEIPTQGKNTPQYLKDIYTEMGANDTEEEDQYDPETDVFLGDRDRKVGDPKQNIFVDSEFLVKNVDMEKDIVFGTPYSLKNKGTIVELHKDVIDEIYIS